MTESSERTPPWNGGRKYILTLACQVTWVALLVTGYLSEPTFVTLTSWTVGGYLAANVVSKQVTK